MYKQPLILLILLLALIIPLAAQNTQQLNGTNEAGFTYRTVPDSLRTYFYNTFDFGLDYKGFSFGMKFNAGLPDYPLEQSELQEELDPGSIELAWEEIYASYTNGAYSIHSGIMEESFGSGIVFRSYENPELDLDYRVTGFRFAYDDLFRFKTLYSGYPNPDATDVLDLAYGADLEVPAFNFLTLGGSYVGMQTLLGNSYRQDDVLGARARLMLGFMDLSAETAVRDDKNKAGSIDGKALYLSGSWALGPVQFGGAYKLYDNFEYRNRLQDLPLANHHNETLADSQGSGRDERGFQAWTNVSLFDGMNLELDYAEAWDKAREKRMNDAYAGFEWQLGNTNTIISYNHIEKIEDDTNHWQKETYPAFTVSFPTRKAGVVLSGEFKTVEKTVLSTHEPHDYVDISHYEPRLQADLSIKKLSLSLALQSHWEDFSSITSSHYWPGLEVKYPILDGTDLLLFAGREAGGKVCRNGVCRYVAPFSGLRLELHTRF